MTGGLYRCSFCYSFPFFWRNGQSFCYEHAVVAGLIAAEETRTDILPLPDAPLRRTKKLTLAEKMKLMTAELQASGDWEDETVYIPDLYSAFQTESKVVSSEFEYESLDGELKSIPF